MVKADGLAAGKGVVVAQSVAEAEAAVDAMLVEAVFGSAGELRQINEGSYVSTGCTTGSSVRRTSASAVKLCERQGSELALAAYRRGHCDRRVPSGREAVLLSAHRWRDVALMSNQFWLNTGAEIVVEEFLAGEEASFFALIDGETCVALVSAQDHKAVGEGDTGGSPSKISDLLRNFVRNTHCDGVSTRPQGRWRQRCCTPLSSMRPLYQLASLQRS